MITSPVTQHCRHTFDTIPIYYIFLRSFSLKICSYGHRNGKGHQYRYNELCGLRTPHNEITIIIRYPDGSIFNVHLCVTCGRPSLCHKVLDLQCQSSIFCCFQTQVIIYTLVVAYSSTCLCYSFISYFIEKKFLLLIVSIRWVTICNESKITCNSAVCGMLRLSFTYVQVGCSGELPKPTMFMSQVF